MLLESLRSKIGGWHRDDPYSLTVTQKNLNNARSQCKQMRRESELVAKSDFNVRLISVKNFNDKNSSLPLRTSKYDSSIGAKSEPLKTSNQSIVQKLEKFRDELQRQQTFVVEPKSCAPGGILNTEVDNIYFEQALRAANTGDVLYLERCIEVLGIAVDAETQKGVTMLQCALLDDQIDCVKLLLRRGADVRKTTSNGRSPLHIAARYGAVHSLKLLLSCLIMKEKELNQPLRGCSYSFFFIRDDYGSTPVHLACRQNNDRCLKLLLRSIIDKAGWSAVEEALLSLNAFGQNPLHVACHSRSWRVVRLLITKKFDKTFGGSRLSAKTRNLAKSVRQSLLKSLLCTLQSGTVLHELALRRVSNCKALSDDLNGRIVKDNQSSSAFERCRDEVGLERSIAYDEDLGNTMQLLLDECPELISYRNSAGATPLMVAVSNDADVVVNMLLSANVDVEEEDINHRTALHHAASRGFHRQVDTLLEHGASPVHRDSQGVSPMHFAAVRGFTSCVDRLYHANCLMDVRTANGHTAFMWAAMHGVNNTLQTMLRANPMLDRYEKDNDGGTALHLAGTHDQYDTIKLLIDYKWYLEAKNFKGETPLLAAAAKGRANAVRAFVESEADVNAVDERGNTALHLAAISDVFRECLHEVLSAPLSPSLINSRNLAGDTPLLCAAGAGATRSVRDLLKHGADVNLRNSRRWSPLMVALKGGFCAMANIILKYSPDVNCYSAMDGCSVLTLAIDLGDISLRNQLEKIGAKLPFEIIDEATRRIQRWYRKKVAWRDLSCEIAEQAFKRKYVGGHVIEYDVPLIYNFAVRRMR